MAKTAQEIAKDTFRSTLVLNMENAKGESTALGSGFVVREGIVATNFHVVKGFPKGSVRLIGGYFKFPIEGIVAFDEKRDLAILKVSNLKAPAMPLGSSDAVQIGESVYAVGNPEGFEGTFSQGIVSGIRGEVGQNGFIQITAPVSHGSSGGPVVNEKGEVIGISTLIVQNAQNLNFAIPSRDLEKLLQKVSSVATGTNSTVAPSQKQSVQQSTPGRILYPWKQFVTSKLFWIGESSGRRSSNTGKSSWDEKWLANFGGYDDPDPAKRIANHAAGEFRPKGFIPKLNPFYIALPYNDLDKSHQRKPEAQKVIPWFTRIKPEPGQTVCKGRWIQVYRGGRSCYGQWEDCGPWETDDWQFVFGYMPPKNTRNGAAGISISPAIRDYLGLKSGDQLHWRFVEAEQIPHGPWSKYGPQKPGAEDPDKTAQKLYLDYLRKKRDEVFRKP